MLQITIPIALATAYILGGARYLKARDASTAPLWAALILVILHFLWITFDLADATTRLSIAQTLSLVSLTIAVIALIASRIEQNEGLANLLFIIAGIFSGATVLVQKSATDGESYGWPLVAHIGFSLISYTLMAVAAVVALSMAWKERQIRSNSNHVFANRLPPLLQLERMLFSIIWAGFATLSLAIFSGMIFISDLNAQHLTHKTVLTVLSWLVFAWLLIGRWRFGWRGATAVKWTLTGFGLLLLAYFGSRVVLELILGKQWG